MPKPNYNPRKVSFQVKKLSFIYTGFFTRGKILSLVHDLWKYLLTKMEILIIIFLNVDDSIIIKK
jgi:hypothetical protein